MSNEKYKSLCNKILSNKEWYKPVPTASIDKFNAGFYALVDGAFSKGVIDQDAWEFMRIEHPKILMFYIMPKVYKDLRMSPGRPIVSGRGSIMKTSANL